MCAGPHPLLRVQGQARAEDLPPVQNGAQGQQHLQEQVHGCKRFMTSILAQYLSRALEDLAMKIFPREAERAQKEENRGQRGKKGAGRKGKGPRGRS